MPRPYRMAEIPFTVLLQKTGTDLLVDPTFGEKLQTINDSYGSEVTLRGQFRPKRDKDREPAASGDRTFTSGYFCCRRADVVTAVGTDLQVLRYGIITGIQRRAGGPMEPERYQITEVRDSGHLPHALLVKIFFEIEYDKRGSK